MLGIITRKIIRNFEDYGFLASVKKGIMYPLRPLYEAKVYRIYSIKLTDYESKEITERSLEFRLINSNEKDLILQVESMEEWLHGQVERKIVSDHAICLVALDDEKVAGFNLVSFGNVWVPSIKTEKNLKNDEAWSDQITVHKNYRRRGLASNLRYKVFEELKKLGIKKLSGGAFRDNEPSLKLTRRVGFKEKTDIYYYKILGYKIYRNKVVANENP